MTTMGRGNVMGERELVRRGGASWVPAWVLAVLILAGLLREGANSGTVRWAWLIGAAAGLLAAFLAGFVSHAGSRSTGTVAYRALASLLGGVWVAYVAGAGWSPVAVVLLGFWAAGVFVLESTLAPAEYAAKVVQPASAPLPTGPRASREQFWDVVLHKTFKARVPVLGVKPWDNPVDGERVFIELHDDMTIDTVELATPRIAARAQLPEGCAVRVLPGSHQGTVILDVMLRDCLADYRQVHEDATASSIYEEIPLARLPRGGYVTAQLREKSMLVGGMTGAGKTTFLHRLIMRMARWVDALIWVVDLNGGGLAWPWVEAWAKGAADKPTIDWVADDEYEAAVMVAVAQAVAKDRKISPEARRRKKAANTVVLPVDKDLPAIVLITDEGAEVAQAAGLIGMLVKAGITRTAQIARAEGVRVVMSVLRGTSDLLDRALKTAMAVMVCLRMALREEYGHVLGAEPRYKGPMPNGSMFVNFPESGGGPILTKTEDVTLSAIEEHSIATAHLRPGLDERAKAIAARLTVRDVLDGRDPREHPDIARHPVMKDVEAGRAYSGRWDRAERQLAELRGDDVPEFPDEPQRVHVSDRPTVAKPGTLLEKFLIETKVMRHDDSESAAPAEPARVAKPNEPTPARGLSEREEAEALLSPDHWKRDAQPHRPREAAGAASTDLVPIATPTGVQTTARELIVMVLRQAGAEWLTATEIRRRIADEMRVDVTKQRAGEVLASLARTGEVERDDTGSKGPYYRLVAAK